MSQKIFIELTDFSISQDSGWALEELNLKNRYENVAGPSMEKECTLSDKVFPKQNKPVVQLRSVSKKLS